MLSVVALGGNALLSSQAAIGNLEQALAILRGQAGTQIYADNKSPFKNRE